VVLLDIALTHVSYCRDHPHTRSYERLAFVGACILNFLLNFDTLRQKGWKYEKRPREFQDRGSVLNRTALLTVFDVLELQLFLIIGRNVKDITPNIKRDVVQSLVATSFLWEGIEGAERFWRQCIKPSLDQAMTEDSNIEAVTKLQELVQVTFKKAPRYETVQIPKTTAQNPGFTAKCFLDTQLLGTGSGRTKRDARQEAARQAILKIQSGDMQS